MRRFICLFAGAAALLFCVSTGASAEKAPRTGVVDTVGTPYVEIDCTASVMSHLFTETETLLGAQLAPEPMSTSSCKRVGKGALAYCAGGCAYTHESCSEVILSSGFTCQCK